MIGFGEPHLFSVNALVFLYTAHLLVPSLSTNISESFSMFDTFLILLISSGLLTLLEINSKISPDVLSSNVILVSFPSTTNCVGELILFTR